MYDPKVIIDLVGRNVVRANNPFAVLPSVVNRWWKGLNLPQKGDTILVTGLMIQFIPLIDKVIKMTERFEDDPRSSWISFARFVPVPLIQLSSLLGFFSLDFSLSERILRNVVNLLKLSGIRFSYRPDLDFYSGILLHDLGDDRSFEAYANRVGNLLLEAGIRTIITIDPHTTYAFKVLYPEYTGIRFQVYTYLELLRLTGEGFKGQRITLHDPCLFGRYLRLSHVPRRLLSDLGVEVMDVQQSGVFTHCCGGPVESLSPKLSREIAVKRLEQLQKMNAPIFTMCPICLENLKKAGGSEIEDLSEFLKRFAI